MRIVAKPRRIALPAWAAAVVLLWGGMVVALYAIDRLRATRTPLCLFKRLTGEPCPACGGTRAVAALARWDLPAAMAMNPLVIGGCVIAAIWVVARLMLGRGLSLDANERRAAWVVSLMGLGANWAYVILRSR